MEDHAPMPKPYEPPSLTVLGSLHGLTQNGQGKSYGGADGFSFMGFSVTNSS